jgi:hypothetical protein
MPMPTMLKQQVRKEEQEDRGVKTSVLRGPRTGLLLLLRRLGSTSRGYALAGAGVVVGAVMFVSLLSWLAPDSDRPIASPLEAVGRVAGEMLKQVDDQVEALLGTDGETVLRSVREGLAAAGSATPWPGNSAGIAAGPSSSTASPDSASSSTDDAAAPTRGESSSASDGAPSEPASSTPSLSGPSETPTGTDAPSSPVTIEPAPPASEVPPVAEEPSPPPVAEEPPAAEEPPSAEEPPPAEEPAPPTAEEPPPVAEEPPSVPSDPPPAEQPPQTIPGG